MRYGEEPLEFLSSTSDHKVGKKIQPDIILLDLNIPKKGREALKEIKSHSQSKKIPEIVLTTSQAKFEIQDVVTTIIINLLIYYYRIDNAKLFYNKKYLTKKIQ
jgi:CheY-like chemotaxis protein